jgi:hypothetical protein
MDSFSLVTDVVAQQALKKDGSELKGMGKKGAWSMATVILENGIKMNVFNPVKVGDTVFDLTQNEYKQWNGKVKAAGSSQFPSTQGANPNVPDMSQPTNAQLLEALRKLYSHIDERFEVLENNIAELKLDADTKNTLGITPSTSSVPSPSQGLNNLDAGKGANRDYEPTVEEVNQLIESGEPIDLSEIPF